MLQFTDQLNRTIQLASPPRRIISLVPSQTELLHYLGLEKEVVGITKFCVHPANWRQQKTIIGGTKQFHHERIQELKPDLIIANKEENTKEDIETLSLQYPVWISDVHDLSNALEMIRNIGEVVNNKLEALKLTNDIEAAFTGLTDLPPIRVAYLIWRKPYMVAAADTFINDMLKKGGFVNVFEHEQRYPEISLKSLSEQKPDCIFLSSEPYPFQTKHFKEFHKVCPNAKIELVDGELFSWYGSRLLKTPEYIASLRKSL